MEELSKLAVLAQESGMSAEEYVDCVLGDIVNLAIKALADTQSNKLAWEVQDADGERVTVMVLKTGNTRKLGEENEKAIHRCKNGTVKPGFLGSLGHRYHPTKGYDPREVKLSAFEKLMPQLKG